MRHAIERLLAGGEDVEILVVNDGSKDKTADIAAEYQQKYPTIVRAINKENGGHGDAVMTGLKNATGLYFKVVDSDDWVDEECLKRVLAQLRAFTEQKEEIDMLICNYVYDKVGVKHKHVMQYRHAVPQNRVFDWNETRFKIGENLLKRFAEECADVAVMDKPPKLEGGHMAMFIAPKPSSQKK